MLAAKKSSLSLREAVKTEIDTLSEEALFAVREFVLFEKYHPVTDAPPQRERNIGWLNNSWSIPGFKPLTRRKTWSEVQELVEHF
jgi:hypothetical protein